MQDPPLAYSAPKNSFENQVPLGMTLLTESNWERVNSNRQHTVVFICEHVLSKDRFQIAVNFFAIVQALPFLQLVSW